MFDYYSVEFEISECTFVYQFKIRNLSLRGVCVLVREGSDLLNYVKSGDILNLKYYTTDLTTPIEYLKTEITDIIKDEGGRFKGVYSVGLSIIENEILKNRDFNSKEVASYQS